jgi:hypothetical protein
MGKQIKWVTREKAKVDRIANPALYAYSKDKVDIKERRSLWYILLYFYG